MLYKCFVFAGLVSKQLGRYASLNSNIYIAADPTPVVVEHAVRACHCIVRPQCLLSVSRRPTYFKGSYLPDKPLHYQGAGWSVNTKHLYNICTMLDQRRRWADVVEILYIIMFRVYRDICYLDSKKYDKNHI